MLVVTCYCQCWIPLVSGFVLNPQLAQDNSGRVLVLLLLQSIIFLVYKPSTNLDPLPHEFSPVLHHCYKPGLNLRRSFWRWLSNIYCHNTRGICYISYMATQLIRKRGTYWAIFVFGSYKWLLDIFLSELTGGTLSAVVPLHTSSLLFLLGGGRSPRYPPNKVILWDDAIGKEVAELEFRERVRGLACRRGWLAVALRRRVVVFEIGERIARYGEWDTCDNPRGKYHRTSSVVVGFRRQLAVLTSLQVYLQLQLAHILHYWSSQDVKWVTSSLFIFHLVHHLRHPTRRHHPFRGNHRRPQRSTQYQLS